VTTAPTRRMWTAAGTIFAGGIVAGVALACSWIGVAFFLRLSCH